MTQTFNNALRFYTMSVNESEETANIMAENFRDKFKSLSKWDQVNISLIIQTDGFEKAFEEIASL